MWCDNQNELHKAVQNDIQLKYISVACRALGLVGKYVTGPWMRLIENDINILHLNPFFKNAASQLQEWSLDPTCLLTGTAQPLFPQVPISEDSIFTKLTTPAFDDETAHLLKAILSSILEDYKRQLSDQLPGGLHCKPSEELLQKAESCTGNNISGERVFGQFDHELRRAPNSKLPYGKAKIMYQNNDTEQCLASLGGKEDALEKA